MEEKLPASSVVASIVSLKERALLGSPGGSITPAAGLTPLGESGTARVMDVQQQGDVTVLFFWCLCLRNYSQSVSGGLAEFFWMLS